MTLLKELFPTKEAAPYLGCAPVTLKQSRTTGLLFGVQAPAFIKMGSTIRYKRATLDKWLAQFSEQKNTAQ